MSEIKALVSAADRAFVRSLIREMRAAIAANPEAPTVTTGPLDPDILERVLNVALAAEALSHMEGWRPIESAPFDGPFLAIDAGWDIRKCWRFKPSSRTDEILTWKRNSKFKATGWMPLPPSPTEKQQDSSSQGSCAIPSSPSSGDQKLRADP